MDLEPVADLPGLVMRGRQRWVCVADLHIGIEVAMRKAGFNIPYQTKKMLETMETLSKLGEHLIILGDLKHKIPSVGYAEDRELRLFIGRVVDLFESVTVVAGNHDGGISSVLPGSVRVCQGAGIVIEDAGVFHGHVWPSEAVMGARAVLMGHAHPSILLVDSLGTKSNEKCWLRGRLRKNKLRERYPRIPDEIIVMPAFNPLLTGTPVNRESGSMLGPLFRNGAIDLSRTRVYLLDGTDLGTPMRRVVGSG